MPGVIVPRPGPTEAEFTAQVIQYAKLCGWRTAHFRAARTATGWRTPVQGDGKGFPDLILIRGSWIIVAELKRSKKEKLTVEQEQWILAFQRALVPTFVWAPEDWPKIEEELKRP